MAFCIWHLSLSIVIWDSSMLHGSEVHSLLLLNNFPVHIYTSLFIHSPAEGPLSWFQFAAIRNKVTINIHICMFNLTRNYQTVFQSDCTSFFILTNNMWGFKQWRNFHFVTLFGNYIRILIQHYRNDGNMVGIILTQKFSAYTTPPQEKLFVNSLLREKETFF